MTRLRCDPSLWQTGRFPPKPCGNDKGGAVSMCNLPGSRSAGDSPVQVRQQSFPEGEYVRSDGGSRRLRHQPTQTGDEYRRRRLL
jgi:hypothetical protein